MTLAKRILVCTLLSIMLLVSVSPVFAETPSAGSTSTQTQSNNQNQSNNQGIIGKQMQKYYEDDEHKPGLLERTIADPLISVANFLLNFFGAKDVVTLVFGIDPSQENPTDQREGLYLGVFTEGMMNAIDALYSSFERFMPFPVILAVLLIAVLLLFQGMSADGRSKAKDYMLAFLVGLLSIRFGYYLWSFVAYVTQKFTALVWATMLDHGIEPDKFLNMIWGAGTGYDDMIKYRGFVVALLVLLAAIMTAVLNYQYTMRTINLMVLVSTFVISAVLTIFPRYRQSLQTWWNEFTSQMLLPCAHALALGLFFLLLRYSSDDVSNWIIVAYLFGFSTIQALVTRLLGGEDGGKVGKAMGFGTMMALSSMLRNKKKGRQTKGVGEQEASASGGGDEGSESSGQSATATPAIKQQRQQGWKKTAGKMGGKAAGYALQYGSRAVGAIAGTSIGMMAGNPVVGAMVGAKAGGAVGGVLGKGTAMLGKGTIMLGKGSLLVGQKVAHGIGNRTSQSESEATSTETPTEESLSSETGNEGYAQPMNPGGRRIGASRVTSAASARNGSSAGNKGKVLSSRPYAGQHTNQSAGIQNNGVGGSSAKSGPSGTKPVGSSGSGRGRMLNSGILITGGKVNSDVISVNNDSSNNHARTQNTGTSTPGRHNRGIWISGGDVKAKSIRVSGDTSGDGVRITGGQVEAEHITPNTDIRPNRPNTEAAPSQSAEAPTAPPQNRHYNYDL